MALLDPVVLAHISKLQLRPRRFLDGSYAGRHHNRNRGTSKEFSEHRPYLPGDDLKSLDWKILGRTDRLVVKQFDEESSLTGIFLIDDSGSMNFSDGGRPSKLEFALRQAAALSYLLLSQGDTAAIASSSASLPPVGGMSAIDSIEQTLTAIQASSVWDPEAVLRKMESHLKRKTFVAVFSDLMGTSEKLLNPLKRLTQRGHDGVVFQILDPSEKDLPFDGPVEFLDMESGEKLKTDPSALRESYRTFVDQELHRTAQSVRSVGLDYVPLTTDVSFEKGLGAYLSFRDSHS